MRAGRRAQWRERDEFRFLPAVATATSRLSCKIRARARAACGKNKRARAVCDRRLMCSRANGGARVDCCRSERRQRPLSPSLQQLSARARCMRAARQRQTAAAATATIFALRLAARAANGTHRAPHETASASASCGGCLAVSRFEARQFMLPSLSGAAAVSSAKQWRPAPSANGIDSFRAQLAPFAYFLFSIFDRVFTQF